jgi:MurNAc alpha-1-phosphate uridylyltransferase
MRPLTDHTPKPLLKAAGKPLVQYHIDGLASAGITDIVINTSWLGQQISDYINNSALPNSTVQVIHEDEPLETAGGIINALPLLAANNESQTSNSKDQPFFIVVNGDVWTNFDYAELLNIAATIPSSTLAHLVMVDNPPQHPKGDFYLCANGDISDRQPDKSQAFEKLTFSGISLLNAKLFDNCTPGKQPLAPLLRSAMKQQLISGHKATCTWMDIGTPERLAQLNKHILAAEQAN